MKQANRKRTQARTDRFRKLEGKHREFETVSRSCAWVNDF